MGCRYCEIDLIENQEHLETCTGYTHEQRGLDLTEEMGKQILLPRMAPKLEKLDDEDKYIALKEKLRLKKVEKAQPQPPTHNSNCHQSHKGNKKYKVIG